MDLRSGTNREEMGGKRKDSAGRQKLQDSLASAEFSQR